MLYSNRETRYRRTALTPTLSREAREERGKRKRSL